MSSWCSYHERRGIFVPKTKDGGWLLDDSDIYLYEKPKKKAKPKRKPKR